MDYFTADTHFSHGNILKYCSRTKYMSEEEIDLLSKNIRFNVSFDSVSRMNRELINNINSIVKPDDTLWHLGDFSFSARGKEYVTARKFREQINCKTVNLIWGNHDRYGISNVFNRTFDKATVKINNQTIIMDHEAHIIWQKSHHGAWHLYGHSHSNAEEWLDKMMPGRRSIDVGVDNALKILGDYRPFSFKDLQKLFANKTGFSIDHHKEED